MKEVILSADGDSVVYLVPDVVADNLRKYCIEFCDQWLWQSPDAKKYRHINQDGEVCVAYCEEDFIDYLNKHVFPHEKSMFVKNLGWRVLGKNLPKDYQHHPYFNF